MEQAYSSGERLLVYPFDVDFLPLLRFGDWTSFGSVLLSAFPGSGLCAKDASFGDGGAHLGIPVGDDFAMALSSCDSVFFLQNNPLIDFEAEIYQLAEEATNQRKNVYLSWNLSDHTVGRIATKCAACGVVFRDLAADRSELEASFPGVPKQAAVRRISTPIVTVLGISEGTDKFSIEVSLWKTLSTMGYKVQLLSSRWHSEIANIPSLPKFLRSPSVPEVEKIIRFNGFIRWIEETLHPDVFVIGVPGGVLPFNEQIHNDFGLLAFDICQAAPPDFSLLSVFHDTYDHEYIERLCAVLNSRLGVEIGAINICSRQVDWTAMENLQPNHVVATRLRSSIVDLKSAALRSASSVPVYNWFNERDRLQMCSRLVDSLASADGVVTF